MKFNISDYDGIETKKATVAEDLAKLETALKDYAIQHEVLVTEVELTYLNCHHRVKAVYRQKIKNKKF